MKIVINSEESLKNIPILVLHLDLDAFFAAVEIRENPSLKNKPVIIGADPKGGKGRGVVSTCSYEARKYGVHSGLAISRAYSRCPHGIYIKPSFDLYKEASVKVMDIIEEYSTTIDDFWQASIDEAYLRLQISYFELIKLAKKMKKEILKEVGLTCSIGIGSTKVIAKIASDYKKPDGLTVVYQNKIKEFLAPLNIEKIPGIGKKSQKHLNEKYKLFKIGQVAFLSLAQATSRYGDHGRFIWNVSNGITSTNIKYNPKSHSQSIERTFYEDTNDQDQIRNIFAEEAKKLTLRLQKKNYFARTISIKIRFADFTTFTRSKTLLTRSTNKVSDVLDICLQLYQEFKNNDKAVRLIGIRCSNLIRKKYQQRNLLEYFN